MSQPNDTEVNGSPPNIGFRQEIQEGVKVAPGALPPQTHLPAGDAQRPLLRRTDSQGGLPFRPPQGVPVRPRAPPPQQGAYGTPRPPPAQGPRFPIPNPVRHAGDLQGAQQTNGAFRRPIVPSPEGVIRGPRPRPPLQPGQLGPRPPGVYPQVPLKPFGTPGQPTIMEHVMQRTGTQESLDYHPTDHPDKPNLAQMKNQNFSQSNTSIDSISSKEKQASEDTKVNNRSENEKDIDTSNEKPHHEELERPESRTPLLTKEVMHKIEEDDDDAVMTPTRSNLLARNSGKTTPVHNSVDNLSQKPAEHIIKPSQPTEIVTVEHHTPPKLSRSDTSDNKDSKEILEEKTIPDTHVANKTPSPEPLNKINNLPNIARTPTPTAIAKNMDSPKSHSPILNDKVVDSSKTENKTTPIKEQSAEPTSARKNRSRKNSAKSRTEGDNDSGVDESMQGNDQSCNGDSPKKTPKTSQKLNTSAVKCKTPVKSLNSPKSPDPAPSTAEKKKVPMNKIQVGAAPSPNLKTVRSKIGSLENATHRPGGGQIKIENKKIDFSKTGSRITAKNDQYQPGGGEKKIVHQKLQWNAKSKIGSLENATYKPGGGDKKIESVKLDFKDKAKPKVGSKDNLKHQPGGGEVKIENKKLDIKAQSKVGSMENMKHKPGGGDIKIFDDKEYLKQRASSSADTALSGSQSSLRSQPEPSEPVSDENLNQER